MLKALRRLLGAPPWNAQTKIGAGPASKPTLSREKDSEGPCSVCGSPHLCRRRERCLIMARFGRWPLAWRKIWAVSMFDLAV